MNPLYFSAKNGLLKVVMDYGFSFIQELIISQVTFRDCCVHFDVPTTFSKQLFTVQIKPLTRSVFVVVR